MNYPLAMLLAALIALGASLIVALAGNVDRNTMMELGSILIGEQTVHIETDTEVTFADTGHDSEGHGGPPFVEHFVPNNIFEALSVGDSLKVVIFCIIFGWALARIVDEGRNSILELFDIVQLACTQVIRWLNLLLPLALFSMVSSQVAGFGLSTLESLGAFVTVQYATGIAIILLCALLISNRAGVSPMAAISNLRETIVLAISTRSSFACIPIAVNELTEKLRFDRSGTDLVMPLGITICRIGAVPYFVIGTIFISEVYNVEMGFEQYFILVTASVAAGFSSSGATGPMGG
ncbi:dicarboxylate/amino acid:cation symporter [Marivivens donghaensis]|uniref:Dicarboxylate/amino acid:cation symporter n=1 Tax=Marivivens donghaensis TaxID=1699413 RepID=A0ABX0VWV7_9RHOB|nr:dicarboxylate/amino acid:cation symporter [Marivivens donghaensis]